MVEMSETQFFFAVLAVIAGGLKFRSGVKAIGDKPEMFVKFQNNYIMVFLVMMAADWMQGPYVYELYSSYNFDKATIGHLFVAGFGSSAICGPIIGALADSLGRKKMCIFFGITYGLSCVTKHFTDLNTLYLGRVLGGISTSILFSCFESWMVTHHNTNDWSEGLKGETYSKSWGWNGMVAVGAGVVTGYAAEWYGPVAAFDCSLVMLTIGTFIVMFTWTENYGDATLQISQSLGNAVSAMRNDYKIILLGCAQAQFEGAMYLFVFMWTPALDDVATISINHGWIFACFMLSCMIGTEIFQKLNQTISVEKCCCFVFFLAATSMFLVSQIELFTLRFLLFLLFEICVGMFWPAIGIQRSKYIPNDVRSTVMNIFRVPLNLIVILSLLNIGSLSVGTTFAGCAVLHCGALVCQFFLEASTHVNAKQESNIQYSEVQTEDDLVDVK